MGKIFKSKIFYLIIFLLFSVYFLGPERVLGFVFGSESNVVQWIRENTIIRLRTETDDVRIGSSNTLFVDTSENKLGVGTNTPSSTLSVIGNSFVSGVSTTTTQYISGLTTNYLPYASTSGLMANSGLYWNNSTQKLGIGTIVPSATLEITGDYDKMFRLSDAGLAHGVTGFVPTNVFFSMEENNDNHGGALFRGVSDNIASGVPILFVGVHGATTPTAAAIQFKAGKKSGTGYGPLGATEPAIGFFNTLSVSPYQSAAIMILGNGNVGIATTTPSALLSVGGLGTVTTSAYFLGGADGADLVQFERNQSGSSFNGKYAFNISGGRFNFRDVTNSTSLFYTDYDNIGGLGNLPILNIGSYEPGNANTGTTGLLKAGGAGTTGTDTAGGDLYIASGVGRGDGTQSKINFYTPNKVGAGTAEQTYTQRVNISNNGLVVYGSVVTNAYLQGNTLVPYSETNLLLSTRDNTKAIRFSLDQGTTEAMRIAATTGNVGIGTTTPTAILHLKSGTATANTAPLKFTSGTLLGTPEDGAVEYDGANFYLTTSATRKTITTSTGGSANKASCWKADGTLGYCSDAVGVDGSCTCN